MGNAEEQPIEHGADWADIAEWWDDRFGDDGDLWHRALIDPTLLRMIGPVEGQQVLDLGCGNGYLSRKLARAGATVTGVDLSAPIIRLATAREQAAPLGVRFLVGDAEKLTMLSDDSLDLVVSNMALMDIRDAAAALAEIGRVLRTGGRLVASISHPCFDVVNASAWVVERMGYETRVWRKTTRYREVFEDTFTWHLKSEDRMVPIRAFHRPLSWYFRALAEAGLVVSGLEEPYPEAEMFTGSPNGAWIAEIPMQCVFEAMKLTIPSRR